MWFVSTQRKGNQKQYFEKGSQYQSQIGFYKSTRFDQNEKHQLAVDTRNSFSIQKTTENSLDQSIYQGQYETLPEGLKLDESIDIMEPDRKAYIRRKPRGSFENDKSR